MKLSVTYALALPRGCIGQKRGWGWDCWTRKRAISSLWTIQGPFLCPQPLTTFMRRADHCSWRLLPIGVCQWQQSDPERRYNISRNVPLLRRCKSNSRRICSVVAERYKTARSSTRPVRNARRRGETFNWTAGEGQSEWDEGDRWDSGTVSLKRLFGILAIGLQLSRCGKQQGVSANVS